MYRFLESPNLALFLDILNVFVNGIKPVPALELIMCPCSNLKYTFEFKNMVPWNKLFG